MSTTRDSAARSSAGDQRPLTLEDGSIPIDSVAEEMLALDRALTVLESLEERLVRVVECRFFGGMTEEETAEALGINARTARRDWLKAKSWLYGDLYPG